jgi:hypothetical protein
MECGFTPSKERPIWTLHFSAMNDESIFVICSQAGESTIDSILSPTLILLVCHFSNSATSGDLYILFSLAMRLKNRITFVGVDWIPPKYRDTPHSGHSWASLNSFRRRTHPFGHASIFLYSKPSDFIIFLH